MKKLIEKVYVDCEQRYYSIFQCNDLGILKDMILGDDGPTEGSANERKASSTIQDEEMWNELCAHIEKGGRCFIVEADGFGYTIQTTLEMARKSAEDCAEETLQDLQKVDKAYADAWQHVVRLKSALLDIAMLAEEAAASMDSVEEALDSASISLDDDAFEDFRSAYIAREEDIFPVLQCIRRFQGVRCEPSIYDVDINTAGPHTPYAIPVRKRLK